MKSSRGLQSCCLAGSFCRVAWEWQEQRGGCGYIISLQKGLEGKNPCCCSSLLGLCPNSTEVGGEILGQEKARTGMIRVSEKQPLSRVQKMPIRPGKMLALPKAEWRSRGWRRELGTSVRAAAGSQQLQGRPRRKLFALDFVPVFLLQRPGKTQRGVNWPVWWTFYIPFGLLLPWEVEDFFIFKHSWRAKLAFWQGKQACKAAEGEATVTWSQKWMETQAEIPPVLESHPYWRRREAQEKNLHKPLPASPADEAQAVGLPLHTGLCQCTSLGWASTWGSSSCLVHPLHSKLVTHPIADWGLNLQTGRSQVCSWSNWAAPFAFRAS